MIPPPLPSRRNSPAPLTLVATLFVAAALLASGCEAARQVPGEAEYLGRGVTDWGAEVIGLPPEEY